MKELKEETEKEMSRKQDKGRVHTQECGKALDRVSCNEQRSGSILPRIGGGSQGSTQLSNEIRCFWQLLSAIQFHASVWEISVISLHLIHDGQ